MLEDKMSDITSSETVAGRSLVQDQKSRMKSELAVLTKKFNAQLEIMPTALSTDYARNLSLYAQDLHSALLGFMLNPHIALSSTLDSSGWTKGRAMESVDIERFISVGRLFSLVSLIHLETLQLQRIPRVETDMDEFAQILARHWANLRQLADNYMDRS